MSIGEGMVQMGKIRPLGRKYEISKHRFWSAYHFAMQYKEWKNELSHLTDTMKSKQITDMPMGTGTGDATGDLAIRRAMLSQKCDLIENTCKEASEDIWKYILEGVTNEGASYTYLRQTLNIPCGKNYYYEKRRKFYYLLANRM